jgi:short-subunit dehydrogenase
LLTGAMGAVDGVPYAASESASKSFVQTLGGCLNDELGPLGIHVTVLVVAPTQTAIIDKFGLDPATMPFKPMSVEQCAREGLEALVKNRPAHINGRVNRMMNALVPTKLSRRMMKQMMERGLEVRARRVTP